MGDGGLKTNMNRGFTRIYANSPSRCGPRGTGVFCEISKIPLANCLTRNWELWYVNIRLSSRAHGGETRAKTKYSHLS